MDILEEIVAHKRREIAERKMQCPLRTLKDIVQREGLPPCPSMKSALRRDGCGIIAEFKRRSPSRGWINEGASASEVPLDYQRHGAAALSILTDERFFGGADDFVTMARMSGATLPVLYKNFVVDEYQLYQSRLCGASAVLLIAACLTVGECRRLMAQARLLGMEVLLEIHSEAELPYADLAPEMLGVNNRNLGTFITDVDNSFRLAAMLPRNLCLVSESGISDPSIVADLAGAGYSGFLIGETFMREDSPGMKLGSFIESVKLNMKNRH